MPSMERKVKRWLRRCVNASGYALEGTVYPTLNYAPHYTSQPVQGSCTLLLH